MSAPEGEDPRPEIPEDVETREVEAILAGLHPFAFVEVIPTDDGAELAVKWGGGLGSKADAAHLLSSVVTNLVHDLSHNPA